MLLPVLQAQATELQAVIADQHAIAVVISKAIDGGEHTVQSLLKASPQAEPRKVNRELSQREQGLWSELHNVEERLAKASQLWEALKQQKHIMHADSFQLPRNIEQYHKEITRLEEEILSVQDELVVANALSAGSLAKQLQRYMEGVQHDSSQSKQKYVNVAYALDKAQHELKTAQSKLRGAELQAAANNSSCLELQAQLQKAELALAAWDSSYATLQDELEQAEGQLATDASYKQELLTKLEQAQAQFATDVSSQQELQTKLEQAQGQFATDVSYKQELQTKLEQAQGELAAGKDSVAKLQQKLQEAQQHSAEHSSSQLALSDKLQNTELRLHQAHDQVHEHLRCEVQWKEDLEQASQRLSDLKGEHESLQQKLHSMEQSGVSQSKHISGLEAELLAAKEQVTDQNSDSNRITELEAKLQAAKQELDVSASQLQQQAEVAEGQLQEVQGREADLQTQLQWQLDDKVSTIRTLIRQLSEAELQLAEDRGNRAELSAKLAEAEDKLQEAVEEAAEQVMHCSDAWLSWL